MLHLSSRFMCGSELISFCRWGGREFFPEDRLVFVSLCSVSLLERLLLWLSLKSALGSCIMNFIRSVLRTFSPVPTYFSHIRGFLKLHHGFFLFLSVSQCLSTTLLLFFSIKSHHSTALKGWDFSPCILVMFTKTVLGMPHYGVKKSVEDPISSIEKYRKPLLVCLFICLFCLEK